MNNRWGILAVLFLARLTMAFQFQSVAALSPWITDAYAIGLAEIGLLIGLYLAPGVLVAIPGGVLAARIGEKRIVAGGMVAMLTGGFLISVAPSYEAFVAGRLIAGAGGVILNIIMTKLLVDWFAGREISTALAIFVNSWPVGIAVALVALPFLAEIGGLGVARFGVLCLIAIGLALFLMFYRPPPNAAPAATRLSVGGLPYVPVVAAGLVWALFNSALAMIFSFGVPALTEQGWALGQAGWMISLFMVIFSLAIPLGGILADRTGRRDLIITVGGLSYVLLIPLFPLGPDWMTASILIIVAALFGLIAGPIMALPSAVLAPELRTLGMGVFFGIYYGVMMVAPRLAGSAAETAGSVGLTLQLGVPQVIGALLALLLFRLTSQRLTVQA